MIKDANETSLLATKLFIPQVRPGLVTRPRLTENMQKSLNNSLTLVSAPAGFGKTTLISNWIQQKAIPAGWLSLESSENDPIRFWEYFIASLRTLQPKAGETARSILHMPQPTPIEATLTALINDLTGIPNDFVLVLDDYHFIQSTFIHNGLIFLLEHLPPKMHLVIATRADPPLIQAHFRGRGVLLEIRADDLRFTMEEASALFKDLDVTGLSSENVTALYRRTEGWVVGLKMAIISLRGEKDVSAFISSFTGSQRFIIDYLTEEVLQKQSPEIQEFLYQTSILERLSGPLCDSITRGKNGRETLMKLENDNLFIVPLDSSREWYRYHHLFSELLRHRLETLKGIDKVNELHKLASEWYERRGMVEDAIQHALATEDWKNVMKLTSQTEDKGVNLVSWLHRIPIDLLFTEVSLYFRYVESMFSIGRYDNVESLLDYAEKRAPEQNMATIVVQRTMLAFVRHDVAKFEKYARQALELLPPGKSFGRATVSLNLAMHYIHQLRFDEAESLLTESLEAYREAGNNTWEILALTYLGAIASGGGKKHKAKELFERAIQAGGQLGTTASAHAYLASGIYYEWNELDKAVFHLERAIELSEIYKGMGARPFVFNFLSQVLIARGDIDGARKAMDNSDRELAEMRTDPAHNAGYHVALALAEEDPVSVSHWVDKLAEYEGYLPPDIPQCARRLLFARKGKEIGAERFKAEYKLFSNPSLHDALIFMLADRALELTSSEESLALLAESFALAKPEGFIRCYVDIGMPLAPLLRKAISRGIEPEYSRKLLDIIEAEERQRKIRKGEIPSSSATTQLLSERELEILRLLAEEISNERIAVKLSISLSTVKTHIHHILEKLLVKDRSQAVYRAKDLKLL